MAVGSVDRALLSALRRAEEDSLLSDRASGKSVEKVFDYVPKETVSRKFGGL